MNTAPHTQSLRTAFFSFIVIFCGLLLKADTLDHSFKTPPDSTKPYMYWYWLNNNVSAKGITADLEAMHQAGIGEAFIGHVISDGIPEGSVPILSPSWWQLVEHAVREGDRIGVRVGMFNCPGWSQSGGPWMKPEQSMRYLVSAETRVAGGTAYNGTPVKNEKAIQDVAVIAYPVPAQDEAVAHPARVVCEPSVKGLEVLLTQGMPDVALPAKPLTIDLFFDAPVDIQTLTLDFGDSRVRLAGKLETVRDGTATQLRELALYRTNLSTAMGPLVTTPFIFAFAPVATDHLRLTLSRLEGAPVLHGCTVSGAARIDFAAEKQLGRMYPEPVPPADAFIWPRQPEPAPGTAVDTARVVDLTARIGPDGSLSWSAPAGGDWVIARIGMASTGVMCGPTPPQARGLECDKMSRAAVDTHFNGMIGEFLRRIPAACRKGFQHITLDSYEVGPQNWTDDMTDTFRTTYGYDPTPWLVCLSGRVVGTREQTDRFLWDWRRLVADLVARNYVGGLKAAANRHGLKTWLENYGHWGFPGESLQYGGASDDIGGEYWLWSSLGDVECRLAASCGHTYGKTVISAEAFTSGKNFVQTPANMKTRGDWCMAQGINHFVLHVCTHQPYDVQPGLVPWFGADFNRNSTWFKTYGKEWTDYLRRCCFLLQQGAHGADVAYFFGEDTPRMNGQHTPPLPRGYDYDDINAEVLLTRATCRDGRLVLPHGQSYRVLVLPPCETMTPRLIKKLETFVRQGLVLVGNPPQRSPSLAGYPACDDEVRATAARLWGDASATSCDRAVRRGRVLCGVTLEQVFDTLALPPDVDLAPKELLWTHRTGKDLDLFFVSNQSEKPLMVAPEFRVTGKQPEIWDAMTGTTCDTALFEVLPHATRVPLRLEPAGSLFVVFRKPLGTRVPVRSIARDGETFASCEAVAAATPAAETPGSFAIFARVKPDKEIALPHQAPRGVQKDDQNFVVFPAHGNAWGEGHAGAGLSVGRNGVVALEHWHQNIAPVLVWHAPAPLDRLTHVALVYTRGVPALYIDGRNVHTGVASGQTPHPSPTADQTFNGTCEEVTCSGGVFTDVVMAEIAARANTEASRPPPLSWPPVRFDASGGVCLAAQVPGVYQARKADGTACVWSFSDTPARVALDATAWDVTFENPDGTRHAAAFATLTDWKDHDDPRIKYFSGTARYETRFAWSALRKDARVYLDLGDVRQLAGIMLNGHDLGVVWKKPFRVEITTALKNGENVLTVRVANTWHNRFVGDEQWPDDTGANAQGVLESWPDWVVKGTPRPQAERVTLVNRKQAKRDTPLQSSGLLGPVTVSEERLVR